VLTANFLRIEDNSYRFVLSLKEPPISRSFVNALMNADKYRDNSSKISKYVMEFNALLKIYKATGYLEIFNPFL
jgi:hypothetical protein